MDNQLQHPIANDGAAVTPAPQGDGKPDSGGACPSVRATTSPSHKALVEARDERIAAFLGESLRSPMAEVGVVGGVTADLARFELRLNLALEEVLAECKSGREYLDAVPGAMDIILKVTRQIERCSRLMRDLAGSPAAALHAQMFGGNHLVESQSEEPAS